MTSTWTPTELTSSELRLVSQAAVLSGATVAIARYSGKGGTASEFQTLVREWQAAARSFPNNPLIAAVLTPEAHNDIAQLARQFEKDPRQTTFQEFKMVALNRCAQAADVIERKASPDDVLVFKQTVMNVCDVISKVGTEKSSSGSGSIRVDGNETGVIKQIARALRYDAQGG